MFQLLLQGVALALPSTVAPSPLKIFLISRSLAYGWRATLPATLVPLVTDGPIIVVTLLLLNQVPDTYLHLLRIGGGFFILYLALRMVRLWRAGGPRLKGSEEAAQRSFREALGINVLNPNPYLLWSIVAGPIVLEAWRQESPAVGMAFIVGFYVTFVAGLAAMVFAFGTAGRLNPAVNRVLNVIAIVALLALGLYQIVLGARALIA